MASRGRRQACAHSRSPAQPSSPFFTREVPVRNYKYPLFLYYFFVFNVGWKFFVVVFSLGFVLKCVLLIVVVVLLSEETKKAPLSLKWQIILHPQYCRYFSWPSTALLQPDQGAAVMSCTTAGLPLEEQVLRSTQCSHSPSSTWTQCCALTHQELCQLPLGTEFLKAESEPDFIFAVLMLNVP